MGSLPGGPRSVAVPINCVSACCAAAGLASSISNARSPATTGAAYDVPRTAVYPREVFAAARSAPGAAQIVRWRLGPRPGDLLVRSSRLRGTVNAGVGNTLNAAAGAVVKGHEAAVALRNSADDGVEAGTATATSARTAANAASSRPIHRAGNVSGSAHGGVSVSGGGQVSGGADDSVRAEGSANAHPRASASAQ